MTILFRPYGDIAVAPLPRTDADTALVARIAAALGIAIAQEDEVDYEDWMEPACMLAAALDLGLEIKILPRLPLRQAVSEPLFHIPGQACRDILIGRQHRQDPYEIHHLDLGWPAANSNLANHYGEMASFHRHAGRKLRLADMPGDAEHAAGRRPVFALGATSQSLGAAMRALAPGAVMVKQVYPAKELPLLSYDLDSEITEDDCKRLFIDAVGFHFARFEGDPSSLLVQEKITMTHETRFFVIDGKVVTGAACIEHHTPQQNPDPDQRLNPIWEIRRNKGEMDTRCITARQTTAELMLAFADRVAQEIAEEAPALRAYTLDVALGADGTPLIIELNPADNAGLYGISAQAYLRAILAYAQSVPHRVLESA